jgi:hypothetical protein
VGDNVSMGVTVDMGVYVDEHEQLVINIIIYCGFFGQKTYNLTHLIFFDKIL